MCTVFDLETKEEIEQRKRLAHEPLNLELREQPWKINEILTGDFIDIPKRPILVSDTANSAPLRRFADGFHLARCDH